MPEISVIVPVYKVKKYIYRCINSIIEQTYRDFELILVDDGSPDDCPVICDDYASKYDYIRVIHKKNGGLSDARNVGTKAAVGKYITYIDSDDYVSKQYLEFLYASINKNKADISVIGIKVVYDDLEYSSEKFDSIVMSGIEALESMLYQHYLDTSACGMLISASIAKNIEFPIGKYHEDELTTYKYYFFAKRVAICKNKGYFYYQRPGSIMHSFGQATLDEIEAADNLVNFCKEKVPHLVTAAMNKKFSDYCQVICLMDVSKDQLPTVVEEKIINYISTIKLKILLNTKSRLKNKLAALIAFFGIDLLRYVYKKVQ